MTTGARFRPDLLWSLAFAVAHAFTFMFLFAHGNDLFYQQASSLFDGRMPYRDYLFEYPPLTLAVLLPPRIFASDPSAYGLAFTWEMLLIDLGIMALIVLLSRDAKLPAWQSLTAYTAAVLAMGSLNTQRYDLFPALLTLAALLCFTRNRMTWCWVLLALGATAKVYPALLAPFLLMHQLGRRDFSGLARGLAAAGATVSVVTLPWVLLSPQGFWESLQYQSGRGLHLESTYASGLLLAQKFGLTELGVVFENGSNNVTSPLANLLATFSTPIVLLVLLSIYAAYAWTALKPASNPSPADFPGNSSGQASKAAIFWSMAIAALLAMGKVLSPQFVIWLIPMVAVVSARLRLWLWAALVAAAALSQYIFPTHYLDLLGFETKAVAALVLRNLLLLAIGAILVAMALEGRKARHAPHMKDVQDVFWG